jgi:hypothetical protein
LKVIGYLGNLVVDGRIILKWLLNTQGVRGGLAEDRMKWQAPENMIMKLWAP